MKKTASTSDARTRLLETADRLFYEEGFRAVGVDRIVAESGVSKMTLYAQFQTKDLLILEVLKYREERFNGWLRDAMARRLGSGTRLDAFFGALKEWFESPNFRGCAFMNACLELANPGHPGTQLVQSQKQRFHDFLKSVVIEVIGDRAAPLAPAIAMLVEGAIVTSVIQGSSKPAEIAQQATMQLLTQLP